MNATMTAPIRSTDEQLTTVVLQSHDRPLNAFQRIFGSGLDAGGRVARLLLFRQMAMKAELDGNAARADFFWRQSHRQLRALAGSADIWGRVLKSVPDEPHAPIRQDPQRLGSGVARDLFLDTHQALLEGYLASDPSPTIDSRAFVHVEYMRDLIDMTSLSVDEKRAILGPAVVIEIDACNRSSDWKRADRVISDLLKRFPEEATLQDVAAASYQAATYGMLSKGNTDRDLDHDAHVIARGLYRLKQLRLEYPHNLRLFEAISDLHRVRALKLAAAGNLAEALADIQAAQTFQPVNAIIEQTRAELEAEMQNIRIQMSAPPAEQPVLPKRKFDLMRKQAARGFRLMDTYQRSDEARSASEDLPAAQGRRIWENLGLGPLDRIDLRPLALTDAIDSIRHAPPARPEDIPIAWETASRDNPHLSGLSKAPIHAYLVTILDGREPFEAPGSAAYENLDGPCSTAPFKVRAGREPFWYWLFSVEDQWLKAACIITVLMVAIGGRFAWTEYSNRQLREIEWEQIHHARDTGDYSGMLDAAESFLSHPLTGEDQRVPEIEALYSEAIVRWFERDLPQGEALNKRLAKYRELHGNANSGLQASQSSQ